MARAHPTPASAAVVTAAPEPGTLFGRASRFFARLFDRSSAKDGCDDDRYHRLFEEGFVGGGTEERSVASANAAELEDDDDDDDDNNEKGLAEEEEVTAEATDDGDAQSLRIGELKNFLVWHVGRIVLWEDPKDSLVHLLVFNVIFWGTVLFQLRGITAVCSAAVIFGVFIVAMEPQGDLRRARFALKYNRFERDVEYVAKELQVMVEEINRECPTMFFLFLLILFVSSALVIPCINPVFLVYVSFTSIFVVPPVFLWFFGHQPSNTEKDGEISEFLPEVTEDNLQVLDRAGETGDSPTPPSSNSANGNSLSDKLDEEELAGLQMMPSHEEAGEDSADDLSDDIEIQSVDDNDGLSKKSLRIDEEDEDSLSDNSDDDEYNDDEEVEEESEAIGDKVRKKVDKLDKNSKHLDVDRSDNSSDDDFEIIEIEELKNV